MCSYLCKLAERIAEIKISEANLFLQHRRMLCKRVYTVFNLNRKIYKENNSCICHCSKYTNWCHYEFFITFIVIVYASEFHSWMSVCTKILLHFTKQVFFYNQVLNTRIYFTTILYFIWLFTQFVYFNIPTDHRNNCKLCFLYENYNRDLLYKHVSKELRDTNGKSSCLKILCKKIYWASLIK